MLFSIGALAIVIGIAAQFGLNIAPLGLRLQPSDFPAEWLPIAQGIGIGGIALWLLCLILIIMGARRRRRKLTAYPPPYYPYPPQYPYQQYPPYPPPGYYYPQPPPPLGYQYPPQQPMAYPPQPMPPSPPVLSQLDTKQRPKPNYQDMPARPDYPTMQVDAAEGDTPPNPLNFDNMIQPETPDMADEAPPENSEGSDPNAATLPPEST